jgi:hypothetical protein
MRRLPILITGVAASLGSQASADFIGWTSTTRAVTGGYLINVFGVTDNSADTLASISGGPGANAGAVTTNSTGGFLQAAGKQSVWAPYLTTTSTNQGSQSWTTLDSFMTVGGSFNTTTSDWLANSGTNGDPGWLADHYYDPEIEEVVRVNAFSTPTNTSIGFTNPFLNVTPIQGVNSSDTGGWFLAGSLSPARSLASLASIRNGFVSVDGISYGSSSQAAADATHGFLVAQFFVAEWGGVGAGAKYIDFKMRPFVRRPGGGVSGSMTSFRIGEIPALGPLSLFGIAGLGVRRRRA